MGLSINQSMFNGVYQALIKERNHQIRDKPDTTGVCDVCNECKETIRDRRLPLVDRERAKERKKIHNAAVSFETRQLLKLVSLSITCPEDWLTIEIDGAAQWRHLLPVLGRMKRPKLVTKSKKYAQKLVGIILHGVLAYGAVCDERLSAGANLMMTLLLRALQVYAQAPPPNMACIMDGGSDLWNKVMMAFFSHLMMKYNYMKEIIVGRHMVGHTHGITVDGNFGDFGRLLKGSKGVPVEETGAFSPTQFDDKLKKAWNSSNRMTVKRIVVERPESVLDMGKYFIPHIDVTLGRYGTPRCTSDHGDASDDDDDSGGDVRKDDADTALPTQNVVPNRGIYIDPNSSYV